MRAFSSNIFVLLFVLSVICLVQFQAKIVTRDVNDFTSTVEPTTTENEEEGFWDSVGSGILEVLITIRKIITWPIYILGLFVFGD